MKLLQAGQSAHLGGRHMFWIAVPPFFQHLLDGFNLPADLDQSASKGFQALCPAQHFVLQLFNRAASCLGLAGGQKTVLQLLAQQR